MAFVMENMPEFRSNNLGLSSSWVYCLIRVLGQDTITLMVTHSIQVQVVERMDVTIHLINHYQVDRAVKFVITCNTYALGRIIIK